MTIIDYSRFCFVQILRTAVPPSRQGKFVVVAGPREQFAVFSPRDLAVYHANVVERFLRDRNIGGQYNVKGDVFYIDSHEWVVEGGGLWRLDEPARVLQLSGRSAAYGPLDLQLVAEQLRQCEAFGGARVEVVE